MLTEGRFGPQVQGDVESAQRLGPPYIVADNDAARRGPDICAVPAALT